MALKRPFQTLGFGCLLLALLLGAVSSAAADPSADLQAQTGWGAVGFGAGYMRFDHLTVMDGLSENSVQAIHQDRQGFLWFGTQEGLNQYDGYDFTVYKADPNDPDALSDAFITAIVEDSTGALWLGTYYGGLNRFDRQTGAFEHFLPDAEDSRALPSERVNALLLTAACRSARALLTTAEHLHRAANVNHDLGGVFFLTRLVSPFTGTQLAFNVDLRTFTQILAGHFRQFAEQHNAVPFSLLFHLTGRFITPGFGSSQRNVGNCATTRHVAYFRVLAQITDENHLVYASAGHVRVS